MRELHAHKLNGCNQGLHVWAKDAPGSGGASHEYEIFCPEHPAFSFEFCFQKGPIREEGVNGLTHETLLAVLIDRLEGFQSGAYECEENQLALDHLRKALTALHDRTLQRLVRGVEGTHAK